MEMTREDCLAMILTKKCGNMPMSCHDSNCYYQSEPKLEYQWLSQREYINYKCEIITRPIVGETEDSVVFPSSITNQACTAKQLYCKTHDSIIIWDQDVIHKCQYEFVQSANFQIIDNVMIDKEQSLLFQLNKRVNNCEMEMNSTTEGLYLTNSSKAFLLPKAENQIKIIDDFILAENDLSKQELFNSISRTYRKANQKFCYLYLTYIKMFAKMEDKFMKFQDFYALLIFLLKFIFVLEFFVILKLA